VLPQHDKCRHEAPLQGKPREREHELKALANLEKAAKKDIAKLKATGLPTTKPTWPYKNLSAQLHYQQENYYTPWPTPLLT